MSTLMRNIPVMFSTSQRRLHPQSVYLPLHCDYLLSSYQPIRSEEAWRDNDTDTDSLSRHYISMFERCRAVSPVFLLLGGCLWTEGIIFTTSSVFSHEADWLRGEWESQTALLRTWHSSVSISEEKKDWNWEIVRNIYLTKTKTQPEPFNWK